MWIPITSLIDVPMQVFIIPGNDRNGCGIVAPRRLDRIEQRGGGADSIEAAVRVEFQGAARQHAIRDGRAVGSSDVGGRVGIDFGRPAVHAGLEEAHRHLVRLALRVIDVERTREIGRYGAARQIAGGVGAHVRCRGRLQVRSDLDAGGRFGGSRQVAHAHRLKRRDGTGVGEIALGVEAPAIEVLAGGVAHIAFLVRAEISRPREGDFAGAVRSGARHEEPAAVNREIGGAGRCLDQALPRYHRLGHGRHATRRITRRDAAVGDQRAELGVDALIAHGVHVGDVVGNGRHSAGLRGKTGHTGVERGIEAQRFTPWLSRPAPRGATSDILGDRTGWPNEPPGKICRVGKICPMPRSQKTGCPAKFAQLRAATRQWLPIMPASSSGEALRC